MVERSEQGKLAPLPGKLLFARYSLAFAYRRIKFKQENSERIVIFPRKIAFFDFFINPERFEQGKLAPLPGKLLFARYFFAIRLLSVCFSLAPLKATKMCNCYLLASKSLQNC